MGWCWYIVGSLTLLLIQDSQIEAAGERPLQSGTVAGVPVGHQKDKLTRPPHPQQLQQQTGDVAEPTAVQRKPHRELHLHRIASTVALFLQVGFRFAKPPPCFVKTDRTHGAAQINLISFHITFFFFLNT